MDGLLDRAKAARVDLTHIQAEGKAIAALTEILSAMAEGEDDHPHPGMPDQST